MKIGNEAQAQEAIALWQQEPLPAQLRNLQKGIESLELGQMYYNQKGNVQGSSRLGRCIQLLAARKAEVDQEVE